MMSADVLRRAASLMRERAAAAWFANGERWEVYRLEQEPNHWAMVGIGVEGDEQGHRAEAMFAEDAIHIASWHPTVALAVADWLDGIALLMEAKADEEYFDLDGDPMAPEDTLAIGSALAVARAYLGADA